MSLICSDDSRNAEFTGDDRAMAQSAAAVGDDCSDQR